jgi:hypothetical protein
MARVPINEMKVLPYYRFKLTLPFNKKQAIQRMLDNTEANSIGKTHSDKNVFIGTLTDNSFKIKKSLEHNSRNSFIPVAKGTMIDDGYYCQLDVKMHPSIITIVFMFIWMSYFVKNFIGYFLATSSISFTFLSLIVFGYLLMFFAFWHEVPKLEKSIRDVFEK